MRDEIDKWGRGDGGEQEGEYKKEMEYIQLKRGQERGGVGGLEVMAKELMKKNEEGQWEEIIKERERMKKEVRRVREVEEERTRKEVKELTLWFDELGEEEMKSEMRKEKLWEECGKKLQNLGLEEDEELQAMGALREKTEAELIKLVEKPI